MKSTLHSLLIVAFMTCGASSALALDWHVNNIAGNDEFNGRAPQASGGTVGPLRTIGRALRLVRPGDRVLLGNTGEPYRETLSLCTGRHCGDPLIPFVIEGQGAVLDGSAPIPRDAWQYAGKGVYRFVPPRVAYQQIYLDGLPAKRRQLNPATETPWHLAPLEWSLLQGAVFFRAEEGKTIDDYSLSHTLLQTGITIYQVHHVAIADLTVQGFQLDGINVHDAVEIALTGVICRGNGRAGAAIVGASRANVERSLLGDNGAVQLLTDDYSQVDLRGNQLLENTAAPQVRLGHSQVHELVEEPAP